MSHTSSSPLARLHRLVTGGVQILDAHAHVGTWTREPWAGVGASWRETVAVFRESGISGAVVFPTGPSLNDALLADLDSAPGLPAWLFPWVSPKVPDSLKFLDTHAARVTGLKIHPSFDRCRLDDPATAPLLDLATEQGWIVQVHCGRWQEMASYRIVLDEAERRPGTNFVLAHMGGDAPELKIAAVEGMHERDLTNVWIELSCTREYWAIRRLVDRYGAARLCYGSDWAMHHPLAVMISLVGAELDDSALAAILGGNLAALLAGRPALAESRP